MSPKVSVVIPTNRYDSLFVRALNSVLAQTLKDIEVLIIVNGPKAAELRHAVCSNHSDPRVFVHMIFTRYINFSLAFGVEIAKSDLVARLDSDDYMHPDRLREQFNFLIDNPEVGVVGSFVELVRGNVAIGVRKYPVDDGDIRRFLSTGSPFCHPAIMLRRKYLFEIGSYSGGILAEDYDLYVRLNMFLPGCRFHNIPKALTTYNIDDGEAKKSRRAYISMISTQTFALFYSRRVIWLKAIVLSFFKLLFRSNKD